MVLKEGFYMIVGQIKQGNLGNKLALSCVERQLLYILEANQVNSNILFDKRILGCIHRGRSGGSLSIERRYEICWVQYL